MGQIYNNLRINKEITINNLRKFVSYKDSNINVHSPQIPA